jgi:hypothetical protein
VLAVSALEVVRVLSRKGLAAVVAFLFLALGR